MIQEARAERGPELSALVQELQALRQSIEGLRADNQRLADDNVRLAERVEQISEASRPEEPETPPGPDDPVTVINRLPIPFTFVYGAVRHTFQAGERRVMLRGKAEFAVGKSVRWSSPDDEQGTLGLVIEGQGDVTPIPEALSDPWLPPEQRRGELISFGEGYAPRRSVRVPPPALPDPRPPAVGANVGVAVVLPPTV